MKLPSLQINWIDIDPGSVFVGSDNRAILFGGIGPRHEVAIEYPFRISSQPIRMSDASMVIEEKGAEIASESEWELANSLGLLSAPAGTKEELADSTQDYWGKACDGRPHVSGGPSPRMIRIWDSKKATPSTTNGGRIGSNSLVRLVLRGSHRWNKKPPKMPENPGNSRLFKEEALICLFAGILPSFFWAFFNASPDYIRNGWLNLIIGGVFFGLLTIVFWRPRQPTWHLVSGEMKAGKISSKYPE